jgi:peroxiredoxin Q/BCP
MTLKPVKAFVAVAALAAIASGSAIAADLEVGQQAPEFSVSDQDGKIHKLTDYHGKTLILAFYPKDFTGG